MMQRTARPASGSMQQPAALGRHPLLPHAQRCTPRAAIQMPFASAQLDRMHAAGAAAARSDSRKQFTSGPASGLCSRQCWCLPQRLQSQQGIPHQRHRRQLAITSASAAAGAAAAAATAWSGTGHAAQLLAARLGAYGAQIAAYLPFLPAAVHALQSVQLPPLPTAAMAGELSIFVRSSWSSGDRCSQRTCIWSMQQSMQWVSRQCSGARLGAMRSWSCCQRPQIEPACQLAFKVF